MITFTKVRWKNFLSTGNDFVEVDLGSYKNTLVLGANGSGKSTLIDAICFALYNKPFRKVTKGLLVNSITEKEAVVELEFRKGGHTYLVRRGIKPNLFEVYRDGGLLNSKGEDYQEALETLTLKHKSFCQIAVLGSASYTPFMELPAAARRSFIEDVLDIGVFSKMSERLKKRNDGNNTEIARVNRQIDICRAKLETHLSHVKKARTNNDQLVADKEYALQEVEDDLRDVRKKLESVQNVDFELAEASKRVVVAAKKLAEFTSLRSQFQSKLYTLKNEMKFYESNTTCPTCKQDITRHFVEEQLAAKADKRASCEDDMHNLDTGIAKYEAAMKAAGDEVAAFESVKRENARLSSYVTGLESQRNAYLRDITSLKSVADVDEGEEDRLNAAIAELEVELRSFIKQKDLFSMAGSMLKDDGIRAAIIKRYIPVINREVNSFLAATGFFVDFQLDEGFNETIKSRYRDKFTHDSFSEGQKDRIDLALLFAWREVARLKNCMSTNLLIMDEVCDGSMDADGVEEFQKFLAEKVRGTNTIVISHRQDKIGSEFDRVLRFKLVKNFSQLEVVE